MDPITQGLLGAAAAQVTTQKRLGYFAALIGALAGMAADLDILIRSSHNPLLFMTYHRGFTHSFIFIPVGGLLIAMFSWCVFKRVRHLWRYVLIAAIAGYATHGLIDWTTSYGTVLLWPFSNHRFALDVFSIVDPIVTISLAIGVVASLIYQRLRPVVFSLVFVLCYLGFGFWQHHRVMQAQYALLKHQNIPVERARVLPNLGNLILWRGVAISGSKIYLQSFTAWPWQSVKVTSGPVLPLVKRMPTFNNPLFRHDYKTFQWFADGYLTVAQTNPLVLVDARYIVSKTPLTSLWGLKFAGSGHAQWIRQVVIKVSGSQR